MQCTKNCSLWCWHLKSNNWKPFEVKKRFAFGNVGSLQSVLQFELIPETFWWVWRDLKRFFYEIDWWAKPNRSRNIKRLRDTLEMRLSQHGGWTQLDQKSIDRPTLVVRITMAAPKSDLICLNMWRHVQHVTWIASSVCRQYHLAVETGCKLLFFSIWGGRKIWKGLGTKAMVGHVARRSISVDAARSRPVGISCNGSAQEMCLGTNVSQWMRVGANIYIYNRWKMK